jgi:hypothetical protein
MTRKPLDVGDPQEDERFKDLSGAIKNSLQHHQFKAGGLLRQALDEGVFGRWGIFRNMVEGEFRISEQQAFRLINAYDLSELLRRHHCPMPINERQVRPLYLLKKDRMRVLAWKRACAQKQGTLPTYSDVTREVNRLLPRKPDETTDARYRAFRKALESARAEYVKAHRLLDDGDLEAFLACEDKKSRRQKHGILNLLEKFSSELAGDSLRFHGDDEDDQSSEG